MHQPHERPGDSRVREVDRLPQTALPTGRPVLAVRRSGGVRAWQAAGLPVRPGDDAAGGPG